MDEKVNRELTGMVNGEGILRGGEVCVDCQELRGDKTETIDKDW